MKQIIVIILFLICSWDIIKGEELLTIDKEIFKPGRIWIYKTFFINPKGDTVDSQTIKLEVFNELCGQERKIKWTYSKHQSYDSDTILRRELNVPISYVTEEITGALEDNKGVFLHPPRMGEFEFTELAPFPYFFKNKKLWENVLTITLSRNEKWLGLKVTTCSEIIGEIKTSTLYKKPLKCLQIDTRGESKEGVYKATYYFHPQYGFVRWEYIKPDSTKVILDLQTLSGF